MGVAGRGGGGAEMGWDEQTAADPNQNSLSWPSVHSFLQKHPAFTFHFLFLF